ncbi:MAG: sensor histidine kinase [Thermogutta sp.]|nr:sensor histidine kinase [Thermogutta sp.]
MSDRQSQRELLDRYHEIARLAGALAHEIKNPLSTIRLNMELLAEDFAEPQTPKERRTLNKVKMVQQECDRLQMILDDFLRFTRADRLSLRPAGLNEEVRRVLQFLAPRAKEAGVEMIEYLTGDIPSVLLDPDAFQSALLNLLINALQAMPNGGQLVVRTFPSPDGVTVDLIDSGCGMSEETIERAFEAFFTTKQGGTGLGLPTARKIIEAHGGSLRIQSEPGKGTQVSITLPTPPRLSADLEQRQDEAPAA